MGKKSETSREDREVVVKLALEGKSLSEIGKIIGRSRSTVHAILRKFMDYGITSNKQRTGRRPVLDETEKREILLEVLRNPNQSVPKLTSEIVTRIGRPVSSATIRKIVRTAKAMDFQGITIVGDSESTNEENEMDIDEYLKKQTDKKNPLYVQIQKQMEYYFDDTNLTKDDFLRKLMMRNSNVDISIFLRLEKIRELTSDASDIVNALKDSEVLSVSKDGNKVFRKPVKKNDNCVILRPLDATESGKKHASKLKEETRNERSDSGEPDDNSEYSNANKKIINEGTLPISMIKKENDSSEIMENIPVEEEEEDDDDLSRIHESDIIKICLRKKKEQRNVEDREHK